MPVPCSSTCGDYTFAEWLELTEVERAFLIYCITVSLSPAE